jgi:hypothetical protein
MGIDHNQMLVPLDSMAINKCDAGLNKPHFSLDKKHKVSTSYYR